MKFWNTKTDLRYLNGRPQPIACARYGQYLFTVEILIMQVNMFATYIYWIILWANLYFNYYIKKMELSSWFCCPSHVEPSYSYSISCTTQMGLLFCFFFLILLFLPPFLTSFDGKNQLILMIRTLREVDKDKGSCGAIYIYMHG